MTEQDIQHDNQNQILIRGCKRLGFAWKVAGQNIRPTSGSTHSCGWCFAGCRYAEKQGTQVTYLVDAAKAGAKFLSGCTVTRIRTRKSPLSRASRARACAGVEAVCALPSGETVRLAVAAPLVALAAGAINTPLVLRRSGLKNPWIGRNLRLHPVTCAVGWFKEEVRPWEGTIMSTVCTEPEIGPAFDYYGAKLECPCLHPGLAASASPWDGQADYKRSVLRYPHQSTVIVLERDAGSGTVVEESGLPKIQYAMEPNDSAALMKGLKDACQILIAAGAQFIRVSTQGLPVYHCTEQGVQDPGFDAWWQQVLSVGTRSNQCGIFSAHQMGTARMGVSPATGAIDPYGQSWEVENLYVCDTSTFPTPSGTNPMVTCFAISHFIAKHIIQPKSKL